MSYLAAMGIEVWRNHTPLPGAKTRVLAQACAFYTHQRPILRLVFPQYQQNPATSLVNAYCAAIEGALNGSCEPIPLDFTDTSNVSPILILGGTLASTLQEAGMIPSVIADNVYKLEDPEVVYTTPQHKVIWWEAVIRCLQ